MFCSDKTYNRTSICQACFNEQQCCAPWSSQGECSRNPTYMNLWCKASCGICKPTTYDLSTECSNRHTRCAAWARSGECRNNPSWMTENCRQACGSCAVTRLQACGGGGGSFDVDEDQRYGWVRESESPGHKTALSCLRSAYECSAVEQGVGIQRGMSPEGRNEGGLGDVMAHQDVHNSPGLELGRSGRSRAANMGLKLVDLPDSEQSVNVA
ncbi:unnamed protein product [Heligmosomoides polygyrus]|uniref:ShKT domain-containing protein n=1 Tax=Heligmosomoides polygyrus TaxID=6339 RepID=A0A183FZD0_HELPZ|nr:unnamed protein product [Heligmosomoides polygyrus]